MSQATLTTPGSPLTMAALKDFLDAGLDALLTVHRGDPADITSPKEGMLCWDNTGTPDVLKRYTETAGWISILSINVTTGAITSSVFAASGANSDITSMTGLDDDGIPYTKVYGAGNLYFPDYTETDQGLTGSGASVKAYVDTIGSDSATMVFRHNSGSATTTYTFSTDETIPANIHVTAELGVRISVDTGKTLTINGEFDAPLSQVFTGDGTVVFGNKTKTAHPEWWGFAESASAAVNGAALQSAYDSLTSEIVLPAGVYDYSTALVFSRGPLTFKGAGGPGHHSLPTGSNPQSTFLQYTGDGVAMTVKGVDANGSYNFHFSDFFLYGTASATGGLLLGDSDTTPIVYSSFKNITVDYFRQDGVGYGIKIRRAQQSIFENVYAHQNYHGWLFTDGRNTTLTFINCHARSNLTYGWVLNGYLNGSAFYSCLAEANGNAGLLIYGDGNSILNFYNWHSEGNNTSHGTAPNIIDGSVGAGSPIYINFWGGTFQDHVGGLVWDVDYANRITWNYITMPSYSGSMKVTANTSQCVFNHWNPAMVLSGITDNAPGRVAIGNVNQEASWTDYSATSTVTGWSAFTTKKIYYTKIGKLVFASFEIIGTSNTTGASFTLPFTSANTTVGFTGSGGQIVDNGGAFDTTASLVFLPANSAVVSIYRTLSGANTFTASGTKQVKGTIVYESA